MTYYPLPTPPPLERYNSHQEPQQTIRDQDSTHDIRSVPTPSSYDYDYSQPYSGDQDVYDEYRGTERPPSFQSTNNQAGGTFLGDLADDDSYASLPPQRRYEARSQVDLDLRLDDEEETVPKYPRSQLGNQVYRDLEDVKRAGEFEDSFEGDGEISYGSEGLRRRGTRMREESDIVDEEEGGADEDPNSPAISFKGGFGAPPTVRLTSSLALSGFAKRN